MAHYKGFVSGALPQMKRRRGGPNNDEHHSFHVFGPPDSNRKHARTAMDSSAALRV